MSPAAVDTTRGAAASLCSVCSAPAPKYKCPGCQAPTCSLSCCKQHKQQTSCTGQRDKLAFVPMQEFTDRHLLSGRDDLTCYGCPNCFTATTTAAHKQQVPDSGSQPCPPGASRGLFEAAYHNICWYSYSNIGMLSRQSGTSPAMRLANVPCWHHPALFPACAAAAAATPDYRWLEEVNRVDDNAKRRRPPIPRKELPQHLGGLVHQARLRGVRLLIMPPGAPLTHTAWAVCHNS